MNTINGSNFFAFRTTDVLVRFHRMAAQRAEAIDVLHRRDLITAIAASLMYPGMFSTSSCVCMLLLHSLRRMLFVTKRQ